MIIRKLTDLAVFGIVKIALYPTMEVHINPTQMLSVSEVGYP